MLATFKDISRSQLGRTLLFLLAVWGAIAWFSAARPFIEFENCVLIAIAFGISISFFPGAIEALRATHPSSGQILAVGVWLSWVSVGFGRTLSLIGRTLGYDLTFFDTDITTLQIWLGILGGVCHLTAPEAIEGWVPTRAWVKVGVLCAFAAGLFLSLLFARGYIPKA